MQTFIIHKMYTTKVHEMNKRVCNFYNFFIIYDPNASRNCQFEIEFIKHEAHQLTLMIIEERVALFYFCNRRQSFDQ